MAERRKITHKGFGHFGYGRDLSPVFLKDIQAHLVPTPEEERAYGKIINREVHWILRLPSRRPIPWEEFDKREVLRQFRGKARKAFDDMVVRNLRLVLAIANRYGSCGAVNLADVVGFGIEGLLQAVLRFDPKRKVRFSTYATWWIRHYITRSLHDFGPTVRTPVHMMERQNNLTRLVSKFYAKHGREPTSDELSQLADCKPADIENAVKNKVVVMSLNQSQSYRYHHSVIHDRPSSKRDFIDELSDSKQALPEDELGKKEELVQLRRAMERALSERERTVLELRFDNGLTLQEIGSRGLVGSIQDGRHGSLSRERIRQIEAEALKKLRCVLSEPSKVQSL